MLELYLNKMEMDERRPRTWGQMSLEHIELRGDQVSEYRLDGNDNYLALHDLTLSEGELSCGPLVDNRSRDLRDLLTFVPNGAVLQGWGRSTSRKAHGIVALTFQTELVKETLEQENLDRLTEPNIYFRNPLLQMTMQKIKYVLDRGYYTSGIYAESLALLAIVELTTNFDPAEPTNAEKLKKKFSSTQQTLIDDYIRQHLADPLSLLTLSNLVGLSRFHFIRAFKATFGLTPHKHINQLRIDTAKKLLRETNFPISTVAEMCGLKPLAHFSAVFRGIVGQTPTQYRLAARR